MRYSYRTGRFGRIEAMTPRIIPYGHVMTTQTIRDVSELGAMLRAYRKSKGLSQVDAAALAGVGQRFLSELERGKATAEVGLVLKVLERFGLMVEVRARGSSRA